MMNEKYNHVVARAVFFRPKQSPVELEITSPCGIASSGFALPATTSNKYGEIMTFVTDKKSR